MTIFEKAAELGAMICDSNEKKRLDAAAAAYELDEELLSMIEKYNEYLNRATADEATGDADEDVAALRREQLSAMYDTIMARPVMVEYEAAKAAFDDLMQRVYSSITYQLTGETACSHNCETCGGSCGSR
ncbi:MAG: YlbF family regulator [Clostridia bacterium]|nr:YlbF family regulator [Clostridia bacterium]